MERQAYWTDLPDEAWAIVERLLPKQTQQRGAPPTVDRRRIIDAIFYVNRTACPWRYLPSDFPNWSTVSGLFWQWRNNGTWMKINDALRKMTRKSQGRQPLASAAIIDSQSAKTTEVGSTRLRCWKEGNRSQATYRCRRNKFALGSVRRKR